MGEPAANPSAAPPRPLICSFTVRARTRASFMVYVNVNETKQYCDDGTLARTSEKISPRLCRTKVAPNSLYGLSPLRFNEQSLSYM